MTVFICFKVKEADGCETDLGMLSVRRKPLLQVFDDVTRSPIQTLIVRKSSETPKMLLENIH